DAQAGGKATAYKLGTFERNNQAFVAIVLNDTRVVDLAAANAAWEGGNASAAKIAMPGDMTALIARYDGELKPRLAAIASSIAAMNTPAAYSYAIDTLKVLPPVRPALILNAGGNYSEHTQGIAANQARGGGPGRGEGAPRGGSAEPGRGASARGGGAAAPTAA